MARFVDKLLSGEFDTGKKIELLEAYKAIMEIENVTESDVDPDGLEFFKQQCDYIDIIIGNHKDSESTQVVFKIDKDKNIIAEINFNGLPRTDLLSYKLLTLTALEDRLTNEGNGRYLLTLNLGTFINY